MWVIVVCITACNARFAKEHTNKAAGYNVVWIMVEFARVWFVFPETKDPLLEEIAVIVDGPQKNLHN
ncbi:uncharacterized protein ALTATR162_LOCUS6984 [Alternaria atra]|uniref:Uncharacterized protein n=1 Tax=Alternaria atra TaxID=119953 RepID=A0A8J2N146_9PLEO|nr:uncharacterized protein ALTATR162_LOCUS6984 [Alternaria atra]CAG5166838.1 unnamed protein product [Alternaria atra]